MKCKDVTAKIDLGKIPTDFIGRLRFRIHLGLCTACRRYLGTCAKLRKAICEWVGRSEDSKQIETLNQQLLKKYSKNSNT